MLSLAGARRLPTDTADEDIHIGPEESGFNVEYAKLMTAIRATPHGVNSRFGNVPYSTDQQSNQAPKTVLLTYLLTPCSKVFLEKLTGFQPVKNSPHFMEPEGSSPHSQVPATCPYPEPATSSPHPHNPLPEDPSYIILPSTLA